jgi:hypothetical protein
MVCNGNARSVHCRWLGIRIARTLTVNHCPCKIQTLQRIFTVNCVGVTTIGNAVT